MAGSNRPWPMKCTRCGREVATIPELLLVWFSTRSRPRTEAFADVCQHGQYFVGLDRTEDPLRGVGQHRQNAKQRHRRQRGATLPGAYRESTT